MVENKEDANSPNKINKVLSLLKDSDIKGLKEEGNVTLEILDFKITKDKSLLDWMLSGNNSDLLNYFYEIAVNIFQNNQENDIKRVDDQNRTILYWAIVLNQSCEVINELLSEGKARIEEKYGLFNLSPLHLAVKNNRVEILKYLARRYPEIVNQRDGIGHTPLVWALRMGHTEAALLVARGVTVNPISSCEFEGPYWSIYKNLSEIAIFKKAIELANSGANSIIKSYDDMKLSPLHVAALTGNVSMVEKILKLNPDALNQSDAQGHPALWWAVYMGHNEVADLLLQNNATYTDTHYLDKTGQNLIHTAVATDELDIVNTLLNHDFTLLNKPDENDHTPLARALIAKQINIASYLISMGADVCYTICLMSDQTPPSVLKWAIINNYNNLVIELLKADVSATLSEAPELHEAMRNFSELAKFILHKDLELYQKLLFQTALEHEQTALKIINQHASKYIYEDEIRRGLHTREQLLQEDKFIDDKICLEHYLTDLLIVHGSRKVDPRALKVCIKSLKKVSVPLRELRYSPLIYPLLDDPQDKIAIFGEKTFNEVVDETLVSYKAQPLTNAKLIQAYRIWEEWHSPWTTLFSPGRWLDGRPKSIAALGELIKQLAEGQPDEPLTNKIITDLKQIILDREFRKSASSLNKNSHSSKIFAALQSSSTMQENDNLDYDATSGEEDSNDLTLN